MLEQLLVTPNPGQWEKGPDMKPRRSFALDLKRPDLQRTSERDEYTIPNLHTDHRDDHNAGVKRG
jgi:hypothetical protein